MIDPITVRRVARALLLAGAASAASLAQANDDQALPLMQEATNLLKKSYESLSLMVEATRSGNTSLESQHRQQACASAKSAFDTLKKAQQAADIPPVGSVSSSSEIFQESFSLVESIKSTAGCTF